MDKLAHDEIIAKVTGWKTIFMTAVARATDIPILFPGKTAEDLTYAQILSAGGVAVTLELVSKAIETAEKRFGGFSQHASDQMRDPKRIEAHLRAGRILSAYSKDGWRRQTGDGPVILRSLKESERAPYLAAVFHFVSTQFQMLEMFYETDKKDVIGLPDTFVYDFGLNRTRAFSVKAVGNLKDDPRLAQKMGW